MTRIFVASLLSMVFASSTFAAAREPNASPVAKPVPVREAHSAKPQTLSFDQFKQLSPADAEAYLEDLRQFALKVETEAGGSVTQNLWMTLLLAQAYAGGQCVYAGYVMDNEADCKAHKAQSSWTLPDGTTKSLCGGQTVCNPMLYGFGTDNNGICLPKGSATTTACDAKYRSIPNYKASDIAKQLASPKMKQQFDSQSSKVKSYCGTNSGESQQKLCSYVSNRTSYLSSKIAASTKGGAAKKAAAPADDKTKKNAEKDAKNLNDAKANAEAKAKKDAEAKAKADADAKARADAAAKAQAGKAAAGKQSTPNADVPTAGRTGANGTAGSGAGKPGTSGDQGGAGGAGGTIAGATGPSTPGQPGTAGGLHEGGQGGAGGVVPKAGAKTEKKDDKKEETRSANPNCIENGADYKALKGRLPPFLQNLEKSPAYFGHPSAALKAEPFDGSMQIKLVDGKMKVITHAFPPGFYTPDPQPSNKSPKRGDLIMTDRDDIYVKSLCFGADGFDLLFSDKDKRHVVVSANGITIVDKKGQPEWQASKAVYDTEEKILQDEYKKRGNSVHLKEGQQ